MRGVGGPCYDVRMAEQWYGTRCKVLIFDSIISIV